MKGRTALLVVAGLVSCTAPPTGRAPAGQVLELTLDERVGTATSSVGDAFSATVSRPVRTDRGQPLVPRDSHVLGEVTAIQGPGDTRLAVLKVKFTEIEVRGSRYPIRATVTESDPRIHEDNPTERGVTRTAATEGPTHPGLLVAHRNGPAEPDPGSTALGPAPGTTITVGTLERHGYLPEGSTLRIRLDRPLEIR